MFMRALIALLGIAVGMGLAVPACADSPGDEGANAIEVAAINDATFIDSLKAAGISYASPDRAAGAAQAVCGLVARGVPGLKVIVDLKANNPGFATDDAVKFAAIAARTYCPHQLEKK